MKVRNRKIAVFQIPFKIGTEDRISLLPTIKTKSIVDTKNIDTKKSRITTNLTHTYKQK